MSNFTLVCDLGNGNSKAALVKGDKVIETVVMPSLLRLTSECDFVRGGFTITLADELVQGVCGWDNANRRGAIVIGNESQGKLKYLPHLLAGVVSSLVHHLPVGSTLAVIVLTLNLSQTKVIADAVGSLATLTVDGVHLKLKPVLQAVQPEGVGCSTFAATKFAGNERIMVFDVGTGTANLSSYYIGCDGIPRREKFEFQPVGMASLEDLIADELKASSSNGKVNRQLLQHALQANTYKLLTSYDGQMIRAEVDRGIEQWLNTNEMKELLMQVIFALQTGVPVCACGGSWKVDAVREGIELVVLGNAPATNWFVPSNSHILGVLGIATNIAEAYEPPKPRSKPAKVAVEPATNEALSV
jgi:hypothetical protein